MKIRILYIAITILSVCGCQFTPQKVELQPQVQVQSTNIGKGQKIYLNTVDERTSSSIGSRGIAGFGAEITSSGDVVAIIHASISENLKKQGFEVSNSKKDTQIELRSEIRNLEYKITPGVFTATLRAESAIKGVCFTNKERDYEHLYRGASERQIFLTTFAEENSAHINKSISDVIQSMFKDDDLLSCLNTAQVQTH